MNDAANEQKKMQIYGMNPSVSELLPIYTETLYEEFEKEISFDVLKEGRTPKVLVCLNRADFRSETENMLDKMLGACRLGPDDMILIALPESLTPQILRKFQTEYIILFGVGMDDSVFRLGKGLNSPFRFHGRKWLLSYSLSEVQKNDALKLELWTKGLKVLFGI